MKILQLMKSIYIKQNIRGELRYLHSASEDMEFLRSLPQPKDDIERSFLQYLCQTRNIGSGKKSLFSNIVALLITLPLLAYFRLQAKHDAPVAGQQRYDAVMTQDFIKRDLLPPELREKIKLYSLIEYDKGSLTKDDVAFLRNISKKHKLSFYFNFKCMCRVAAYAQAIRRYNPTYICAYAEYSFTSSILTAYCETKCVQHINIMHGEKLFDLTNAYARFNAFYLWDEFYVKLFNDLRADKTPYIVFRPPLPSVDIEMQPKKVVYYLQVHTHGQLLHLKSVLDSLNEDYIVRPHPSYCDRTEIVEVFGEQHVEDNRTVSIWESLSRAKVAISINSTVLLQAYWIGVDIVIDDISHPQLYTQLSDRRYVMLQKPHILLSAFVKPEVKNEII